MYNIVQLIVYSEDTPDKSKEGNLLISRKIIIKGDLTVKDQILIDDDEAIELPFHMIQSDAFAPNDEWAKQLNQLLPEDKELLILMKQRHKKVNRTLRENVCNKSFEIQDYEKIREWLER